MSEVKIPHRLEQDFLLPFFQELRNAQSEQHVFIDFTPLSYSFPLSMLVAGSYLRQWIKIRKENGLDTTEKGIDDTNYVHTYLMHLGFFNFIGIDRGKQIGEATGSTRYLPIRRITRSELEEYARACKEKILDAIEFQSKSLANILSAPTANIQDLNTYSYAIREILRNVFEHSGADECFLCGQRWQDGKAQIAILDEGCGIYETIKQAYNANNDEEAIKLSVQPGITRTKSFSDEENIHGNSGYGLYVLSQLGSSFGWFSIGSGSSRLTCESQNERIDNFDFNGTFLGVHLNRTLHSFRDVLKDIISEGEKDAQAKGRRRLASSVSKSLSFTDND
ncbi:ATP-binding protein [Trichocoleus sp. Lan]|uniref:ATP-binding protein n=1 Tax=Trichocoleus sp. Lan TaxID=2933927 RepID=UPI003299AA8B